MKFNPAGVNNPKFTQGYFIPKNPAKYVGDLTKIKFLSSWEKDFFHTCDLNPAIIQWGSESISIPYNCPLSGKVKQYFPDVFICYMDKNGKLINDCIEIKPAKQSSVQAAKTKRDKIQLLINQAKWLAAGAFCQQHGLNFRIITEAQLYAKGRKK